MSYVFHWQLQLEIKILKTHQKNVFPHLKKIFTAGKNIFSQCKKKQTTYQNRNTPDQHRITCQRRFYWNRVARSCSWPHPSKTWLTLRYHNIGLKMATGEQQHVPRHIEPGTLKKVQLINHFSTTRLDGRHRSCDLLFHYFVKH